MNEEKKSEFVTPILFVVFNRPETTKKVFKAISKIKPTKLYIAADGPRLNREGEGKLCEETRKIIENIDWDCEVYRKYSDKNIGCKFNMSGAIDWFFENETEGIILEDDCLPNISFFYFCEELLEKYRNVNNVKMISGNNFQFGNKYGDASYYFSNFPNIWGWATWRRAWKEYDIDMKSYPDFKKSNKIENIFTDKKIQRFIIGLFDKLYKNEMNTWAGRWVYSICNNGGVSIVPNVNLVSNIGFSNNATNTIGDSILNNIPTENLDVIIHAKTITVNEDADKYIFYKIYYTSLVRKILNKVEYYLKK